MAGITGFGIEVPAPPLQRRDRGLLIDSLLPITLDGDRPTDEGDREGVVAGRMEGGLLFCKVGCAGLNAWADSTCVDDVEADLTNTADGEEASFDSFVVSADETSPARFDEPWIRSRLGARMDTMISAQLAAELQTGALTGNASLQDAATHVVAAATPAAEFWSVLEDILASFEDLAFYVHMEPRAFAALDRDQKIAFDSDSGHFRTPTGHIVIADAGHDGAGAPDDPDSGSPVATAANGSWVYASLPVSGWVGPERTLGVFSGRFDRERNTRVDGIIRPALVAFDPCAVVAVQLVVPTYTVDTAGS